MAEKKKKTAPSKKRAATQPAAKAPKKKTGNTAAVKGKTLRAAKSMKPVPKTSKNRTVLSRKPVDKKVAAPKKTAVKTKIAAKTKVKKVSKAPAGVDTLKEIKRVLIKRREAIVREAKEEIAKYISGENRQLVDTALDDGDWAVVDISEDLNLRRLATHRKSLHDIDEALTKIAEGSYGICEECGEPIGEKRLSVLPAATLCVICQGNKERLEEIEKERPLV